MELKRSSVEELSHLTGLSVEQVYKELKDLSLFTEYAWREGWVKGWVKGWVETRRKIVRRRNIIVRRRSIIARKRGIKTGYGKIVINAAGFGLSAKSISAITALPVEQAYKILSGEK